MTATNVPGAGGVLFFNNDSGGIKESVWEWKNDKSGRIRAIFEWAWV